MLGRVCLKTFFLHPFVGEQNGKRDDPGPLECAKTIVITCVSATSPHGAGSYEKDDLGLHFGGLLGPLLPQIGHRRRVQGRFFGGRNFKKQKGSASRNSGLVCGGWGSLKKHPWGGEERRSRGRRDPEELVTLTR